MVEFAGRHVVVTGGTGALGRAVVGALRAANAVCHVPNLIAAELDGFPFAAEAGVHIVRDVDVADEAAVKRFYNALPPLWASIHLAGGFAMAWNGLSFTAAAELAGRGRSGAALGMQQTALAAAGAIVPPAFAAVVAATSWRVGFAVAAAFPLAGVQILRSLRA